MLSFFARTKPPVDGQGSVFCGSVVENRFDASDLLVCQRGSFINDTLNVFLELDRLESTTGLDHFRMIGRKSSGIRCVPGTLTSPRHEKDTSARQGSVRTPDRGVTAAGPRRGSVRLLSDARRRRSSRAAGATGHVLKTTSLHSGIYRA
jgi:hypothetical protein